MVRAQPISLQGIVMDSASGGGISYATIIINDNNTTGTRADSSGHFVIRSAKPLTSLTFSMVGYQSQRLTFSAADAGNWLNVYLVHKESELDNITVLAGENPANRIIKAAVKNREKNNYANLRSYAYTAYEKFVLTGIPNADALRDSSHTKLFRYVDQHHLLVMESVVKRIHLEPDLTKETVMAQKVSGLQNPNFTVLTSEFQTTNFYKPFINITTTDFVNPISPNSWNNYFFNIIDTVYSGQDTVFVMTYNPAKGKHFSSLKGIIEINSDGYAIQHVVAEPSDTSLATLFVKIEQRYAKADSTHWFLSQINTNIGFKKFFIDGLQVSMTGTTHVTEVTINPPLTRKDFDGVGIDILEDAAKKSDDYWNTQRAVTLTEREKTTYSLLDSVGSKNNFDNKINMLSSLQDGNLKLNYVSVQLYNVIKYNRQEGIRLGMGLETNSDLMRKYKVGGFAGYGLHDHVWKYGGFFEWKVYYPKNIKLLFNYSMSYEESGGTEYYQGSYWGNNENSRNYTITNFDFAERKEIAFTSRIRKYVNLELTAFDVHKDPTSSYAFVNSHSGEPVVQDQFDFAGFKAAARFSYKERIVESLDRYYWINMGYPTVWLQVTQGINGFINGEFTYTKYETKFSYAFPTKSIGITNITLEGGWVNTDLPATDLFSGRSSYSLLGLFSANSFQTMRSNEFVSNGFASVFFRQDFQSNIIRWGKFQPNFVFVTNIGWGKLSHPEDHLNTRIRSMEKGYFESGLMINNLAGKKFFGIARLSIGGGVFYRYGPYAFSNVFDNLAMKLSWSYNFK